jgi:hypothetical protein
MRLMKNEKDLMQLSRFEARMIIAGWVAFWIMVVLNNV